MAKTYMILFFRKQPWILHHYPGVADCALRDRLPAHVLQLRPRKTQFSLDIQLELYR